MCSKRVLLINNPVSGKGARDSLPIERELQLAGYEVTVYETTPGWEKNQEVFLDAFNYDTVVCSGGDGTINAVVNGLLWQSCKVPVLCIPSGTTNDLAKSLCLPGEISKSVKSLDDNACRKIDAGLFNQKNYFTYIASMGAFTDISYTTPQELKNRWGHVAYIFRGIANLAKELRPTSAVIQSDNAVYEGEFLFCSISNSTSIGGILSLQSENVSFDDGFFEVLLVRKPKNPLEIFNLIGAFISKSYLKGDVPGIEFFHTKHLHVDTEEKVPWTLDGEYGGSHESIAIDVIPSKIQLVSA